MRASNSNLALTCCKLVRFLKQYVKPHQVNTQDLAVASFLFFSLSVDLVAEVLAKSRQYNATSKSPINEEVAIHALFVLEYHGRWFLLSITSECQSTMAHNGVS